MKIDVRLTPEEIASFPNFDSELAAFQQRFDALENDQRRKFRLCLHEAGHMVYFRRIGWDIENLHGPHVYLHDDGKPRNALGAVSPVSDTTKGDFIAIVKTYIAGFVLVEALTGEPDSEAAINGDMETLTRIEAPKEAINEAKEEILQELNDSGFTFGLMASIREYENTVFGTSDTWRWGWNEFRLDIPGQRYAVGRAGIGWMLIEHENKLRFIVRGGRELLPDDANLPYFDIRPVNDGERAADAVRRWNEMVAATRAYSSSSSGFQGSRGNPSPEL